QWTVHHSIACQHDGIVQRATTNQAHRTQRLNVALEAKGSRARQKAPECDRTNEHLHFLLSDQRMSEIDIAAHAELIGWVNTDAPKTRWIGQVALRNFQRLPHFQVFPLAAQLADPSPLEHLHKGFR